MIVLIRCAIVRIVQSANSCNKIRVHPTKCSHTCRSTYTAYRLLYQRIRLHVTRSRRLVKHKNLRLAQHRPRKAHQLSLPNTEVLPCIPSTPVSSQTHKQPCKQTHRPQTRAPPASRQACSPSPSDGSPQAPATASGRRSCTQISLSLLPSLLIVSHIQAKRVQIRPHAP